MLFVLAVNYVLLMASVACPPLFIVSLPLALLTASGAAKARRHR